MLFSIELCFDDETAEGVRRCWQNLANTAESDYMEVHGIYPHVALSVFDADNDSLAEAVFEECRGRIDPFRLDPCGIGSFSEETAVVFIGFAASPSLLSAHEATARALSKMGIDAHSYYRRENWRPHCTLAMNFPRSHLAKAQAMASTFDLNLPYRISDLALVSFPPTRLLRQEKIGG